MEDSPLTDHIDYTQQPKVLKYLGWQWVNCSDPQDDGYWEDAKGDLRIDGYEENPPTMQELWEGLCKACLSLGFPRPVLTGMDAVNIDPHGNIPGLSIGSGETGTLNNCIAAALYYVLQQDEKKEG